MHSLMACDRFKTINPTERSVVWKALLPLRVDSRHVNIGR